MGEADYVQYCGTLISNAGRISEQNDNKCYATELSPLGTDPGRCHGGSQCGGGTEAAGIPEGAVDGWRDRTCRSRSQAPLCASERKCGNRC